MNGSSLSRGFSLGIDTSNQERYWVSDEEGFYRLDYPTGQEWGAVFFTVGNVTPPGERETLDLSEYAAVAVDLRGEIGGEIVSIGIKDSEDLNNGLETKFPKLLTASWQTYVFPLSDFVTADLTQMYIPLEIVFEPGTPAQTIYLRNVRYLRNAIGG